MKYRVSMRLFLFYFILLQETRHTTRRTRWRRYS